MVRVRQGDGHMSLKLTCNSAGLIVRFGVLKKKRKRKTSVTSRTTATFLSAVGDRNFVAPTGILLRVRCLPAKRNLAIRDREHLSTNHREAPVVIDRGTDFTGGAYLVS